jgi:hypothetical protein
MSTIDTIETDIKTRNPGPLSARLALQNPRIPNNVTINNTLPCKIMPGRLGGRKINTSLTRGIIVEFMFAIV